MLQKKNLEKPLEIAFKKMRIIQRNVRGSESEKDNLMPRFFGLRLWSGCSSLFFTLNPHDIRSSMTIILLQNDCHFEKKFSLDWNDADTEDYVQTHLKENRRKLHEAVAANPMAATRCFHWTVKLVLAFLFNCSNTPGKSVDGIAAHDTPGIFGHVRAYMGIVEPQMRKALHIHMLVQLLGFSHPEDLFNGDLLPELFRRLWLYVASICFRSTEAFADYLAVPSAMEAFQNEVLLPLTQKQRGMIGESRTQETLQAQLKARGQTDLLSHATKPAGMSYVSSAAHSDPNVSSLDWSAQAVHSICASTRGTGNHVCRPDVCHKGPVGKKGFCRMGFWHWSRSRNLKGDAVAKRSHGHALQERWNGTGEAPLLTNPLEFGAPALEITHPFHFKMTPSMLLGPTCNHDLGVLLRLPPQTVTGDRDADSKAAAASMLDAMGDHEYYVSNYASKDQPHVEGLLQTLQSGLRSKEIDLAAARAEGHDMSPHENTMKLMHRMIATMNRSMHKGFPEMFTYLKDKPMQYCSHDFVSLSTDRLFRKLWFLCFKQWERGQATHASLGPSLPLSGSVHFHPAD